MRKCSLAIALVLASASLYAGDDAALYAGAEKCKLCHSSAAKGSQYGQWDKSPHHEAFEVLASSKAKKIAKKYNIADPQKDSTCLGCHVTAADIPAEKRGTKLDYTQGVQCESCHGPAAKHVKARLEADEEPGDQPMIIGKNENIPVPKADVCTRCHNEKSPTFEGFSYAKNLVKISHLDPRKGYPADYIEKLGQAGEGKTEEKKK